MKMTPQVPSDHKFIAFLDILGFKKLIEANSLTEIDSLYEEFRKDIANAVNDVNQHFILKKDDERIENSKRTKSMIASDSIFLWTEGASAFDLLQILFCAKLLVRNSFLRGLPLRGAICFGEVLVKDGFVEGNPAATHFSVLGRPLTRAYELEKNSQWAGCVIDHNCIGRLESIKDDFYQMNVTPDLTVEILNDISLTKEFSVPFKNGNQTYLTIDWTVFERQEKDNPILKDDFKLSNSFEMHNKNTNDEFVLEKIRNSETFLEHCKSDHTRYYSKKW